MKCLELNLEEGFPTCDEAINILKFEISRAKEYKYKCLYIIHGYGSSGTGGKIKVKVRQYLFAQEKKKALKSVIKGEEFNLFNEKAINLKNKYMELSKYFGIANDGVTIIEL